MAAAGRIGNHGLDLPGNLTAYDALYAFGDNLTDTGREPAEPVLHYRWSNGPLWVGICPNGWASPTILNNYAHSGARSATTPSGR